ncbi:DUF2178 domain-containing protein [Methanoplanus limicola]|jgi:uncharacterized membrane protein|uniref:DUF2178 domain-containing protein n=1 Tax=Methanoplanus limicola DSM 2279 TaxID=937775 RepID=H1YYI4_9EURY|nr:DUF2178 domain-containing protein [Methanoplanus limicola]EHQ35082.1 Protein of unknown function DUF2178, transmembrane [Methanoplanus limicola DSM 2279]
MRRNTYFIIVAGIAFLELCLLWWSINNPPKPPGREILAILIAAGIIIALLLKGKTEDLPAGDERLHLINEKSAIKTLQITWVLLFSFAASSIVFIVNRGDFFIKHFLGFPFIQMLILFSVIVIFAAFRIYYTDKYGGFDSDEE